MPEFVILEDLQRKLFFKDIKENINCSWEKLYLNYSISKSMFYNYLSGQSGIPKDIFDEWNKLLSAPIQKLNVIEKEKYIKKDIPPIKLDEKLAEIIGILNGDGHISPITYEVCIVGNRKEIDYLSYLKKLFESKFKLKFKSFTNNSSFKLRTYSIELFNLLTKEYHLPKGNKMGKLKIPSVILSSRKLLISYIRGLFDTDGTIYQRRKKDVVLEISSADTRFLKEIHKAISSIGFNVKKYQKHVNLYNLNDIINFFQLIKPANNKHLKKFKLYVN